MDHEGFNAFHAWHSLLEHHIYFHELNLIYSINFSWMIVSEINTASLDFVTLEEARSIHSQFVCHNNLPRKPRINLGAAGVFFRTLLGGSFVYVCLRNANIVFNENASDRQLLQGNVVAC